MLNKVEERFVVVRDDNHHFIMNVDESLWTHNIANARTYTKEAALDKVDEIEDSDLNIVVYASPLRKEMKEYEIKYR